MAFDGDDDDGYLSYDFLVNTLTGLMINTLMTQMILVLFIFTPPFSLKHELGHVRQMLQDIKVAEDNRKAYYGSVDVVSAVASSLMTKKRRKNDKATRQQVILLLPLFYYFPLSISVPESCTADTPDGKS